MTPLQAMGEALKALRAKITKSESLADEFRNAVTDGFMVHSSHITDLFEEIEALKSENRDLRAKIKQQDATIIEILDVVSALKPT